MDYTKNLISQDYVSIEFKFSRKTFTALKERNIDCYLQFRYKNKCPPKSGYGG